MNDISSEHSKKTEEEAANRISQYLKEFQNAIPIMFGVNIKPPKPLTHWEKIKIRAHELLLSAPLNNIDGIVHWLADLCKVDLWRSNCDNCDW